MKCKCLVHWVSSKLLKADFNSSRQNLWVTTMLINNSRWDIKPISTLWCMPRWCNSLVLIFNLTLKWDRKGIKWETKDNPRTKHIHLRITATVQHKIKCLSKVSSHKSMEARSLKCTIKCQLCSKCIWEEPLEWVRNPPILHHKLPKEAYQWVPNLWKNSS